MNPEQIQTAIAEGMKQYAKDQENSLLWVDREKHHKHHELMDKMIIFFDDTKTTIWKTFVRMVVVGILGIFVLGLAIWLKTKGGG
jgi:hypothetical protein